jgi:soluble lytic murein transglycosylase-like protein
MQWKYLVEYHQRWIDLPTDLVLAVIAQESWGINQIGCSGEIGLMMIIPGTPAPLSKRPVWCNNWAGRTGLVNSSRPSWQVLMNPKVNIGWGMSILYDSIYLLADGDIRKGLAYYNCGVKGVEHDKCGSYGGYNYADKVLNLWLPLVREKLYSKHRFYCVLFRENNLRGWGLPCPL